MILQILTTAAAVAVPIVVAFFGYRLNQRLKLWEASQWRNQELIKARLQYFAQLAPLLNDVMCYFSFIGRWKELSPPEIIGLKREIDRQFLSIAPLFSQRTVDSYREFMSRCFLMASRGWGDDALIRSGFVRRRDAWRGEWDENWSAMFTHTEQDEVAETELESVREGYDRVLVALVEDIELLTPRQRYAPDTVVKNAK